MSVVKVGLKSSKGHLVNLEARYQTDLVQLLEPETLLVVWSDGHESLYSHKGLRETCECASCVDEWTREPLLDPQSIPGDLRCVAVEATGRYGLNLQFSDGHATGIWSLEKLRKSCPCPECLESSA